MSTRKRRSKVKLIGAFIIITGALVVVAAGVTLGMVSSELKAEHIAATAVTPAGAHSMADADLFNAYAPARLNQLNRANQLNRLNQASSTDVMTFPNTPDSGMNGSFLRALFFIAAVALGVAAPVMGVGVMFAVIGIGPMKGSRKR
jgi:drug/metabolite transporter (DMT)-like permease